MTSLPNDNSADSRFRKEKTKKRVRPIIIAAIAIIAVFAVMAATYFFMYLSGRGQLLSQKDRNTSDPGIGEDVSVDNDGDVIVYNGKTYSYNDDITAVLFMGVDVKSIKTASDNYGTNGQADAIYVMTVDTSTGKTDVISISRDTMTDVAIYSVNGKYIGTEKKQLCLAYAYGDRRHKSCENVLTSVTRLLYGMPINTYLAIDLSGVAPLTDAMGGVTVGKYNSDYTEKLSGTVKLTGKQAEKFVRNRDTTQLKSNNVRMEMQQEFLKSFIASAKAKTKEDLSTPLKLYNIITDYSVSNVNASKITYLASRMIASNMDVEFHTVKGTITAGEHAEFNVDKQALFQLVLDIFYETEDNK